jgi:hypothetical protein
LWTIIGCPPTWQKWKKKNSWSLPLFKE